MATQKFIDAWDDIIAKWMNIPCVSDPSNPFKPLQVHPNLDPTNVIDIAIKNSDAKFGFAVGKPIYEALKSIGYTDIQIPNPHNVKNAKGKQNARQFAVVERNGAKVLCTWTSGGNSCPSAAFDSYIEQDIMPLL